jgi:hypothetical protein
MPSRNYIVDLGLTRRVRVNSCEGEISVITQLRDGPQHWISDGHPIVMTREQAMLLRDRINRALED